MLINKGREVWCCINLHCVEVIDKIIKEYDCTFGNGKKGEKKSSILERRKL